MTGFQPEQRALGAELDRLAGRYDDLEETLESLDAGSEQAARYRRERDDVDREGRAVEWLINGDSDDSEAGDGDGFDGYGADATVTVRGLDAGEYARVENRTADAADNATAAGVPGTGKLIFAATGLVDAPFLGDGHPYIDAPLNPEDVDDRLTAFVGTEDAGGLPIGVRKWVEDLVSERTSRGEKNWQRSAGRSQATEPED